MRHVIIGTGPAGVNAAETLRKLDANAKITLIGGEREAPYSRMAIPYVLSGAISEAGTRLRQEPGYFDRARINVISGPVARVDTQHKAVELVGGNIVEYDRLLIAAGASPIKPHVPGLDLPGVHHCWSLADMRAIEDLAGKGDNVVLMGAGFIGSIILESLKSRGVNLTVVEVEDRMVPRMLDETAGALLKSWCESKGVSVRTGTRIEKVKSGTAEGLRVHLSDGAALDARLLVVAAGVKPNTEFLIGSGVETDRGIRVDARQQTSVPDIFAAGDIVRSRDFSTGRAAVMAIQPVAVDHARIAAVNMTGGAASYQGALAMNVLDTMGLISTSFGLCDGPANAQSAIALDAGAYKYMRLEFDGNVLTGAQSLGLPEHIGVLRGFIQSRLDLGGWKERLAENPLRLAEAYVGIMNGV